VVFVKDLDLRYILVNREYELRHQVCCVTKSAGKLTLTFIPHEWPKWFERTIRHVIEAGTPIQFEEAVPMAGGERRYVVWLNSCCGSDREAICGLWHRDRYHRIETGGGEKLAGLNRTLQTLYQCNQALVRATESTICCGPSAGSSSKSAVFAWPGSATANSTPIKTVRPVAQAGYEAGYLERIDITWADTEMGRGPTGIAIRTGTACWTRTI